MTRRPKKTLAAPMMLRTDQLSSKNTGSDAMMLDSAAPAPLGRGGVTKKMEAYLGLRLIHIKDRQRGGGDTEISVICGEEVLFGKLHTSLESNSPPPQAGLTSPFGTVPLAVW
jgi:hypothetical protein